MKNELCTKSVCTIGAVEAIELRTGDIISRRAKVPFWKHYGIVVLENGNINVWHNSTSQGRVVKWTLAEWQEGIDIEAINGNIEMTAEAIEQKIATIETKRFDFASWNCEHFINFMDNEPIKSKQVTNTLLTILGIFIIKNI